ncbi:MAG TPA: hypothetical protein VNG31_03230 [Candidatus Baltobacteraceae bacterium]|nr:hypothetical protein [Candidatus Baltobacteraceae bacterium]
MRVGRELLHLTRAAKARSLFVVGIGKNVGKTVTMRAVYEAAGESDRSCGLTSIGRDGEAADASDARPKPRLFLRPGTIVATARSVLPRSPASEILEVCDLHTAAGGLVLARVHAGAFYELVGPPTASGIRSVVESLSDRCDLTIVDGAVDRVAALAGGRDAVVVACGAAAGNTSQEVVDEVRALVQRLTIAAFDSSLEALRIEGALTAGRAAELIARRETRQIVVRDPTQIALAGKVATHAFEALRIRCERPIRVVAVTIASIAPERSFEPKQFGSAVARATGLPTFDVYAGAAAA